EEIPAAVEEALRHAMADDPCGSHLQPRPLPETRQADGIVAARVVSVDVEDLDRIAQLVVVAGPVIAMANLLKPERVGLLPIRHAWFDGRRHDLVECAKAIATVR